MHQSVRLWLPLFAALCLCLAAVAAQAEPASAPPPSSGPLLQQGKKSLFQRVVSHPGASLRAEPRADAAVLHKTVVPFTVLYVYARQDGWLLPPASPRAGWKLPMPRTGTSP